MIRRMQTLFKQYPLLNKVCSNGTNLRVKVCSNSPNKFAPTQPAFGRSLQTILTALSQKLVCNDLDFKLRAKLVDSVYISKLGRDAGANTLS